MTRYILSVLAGLTLAGLDYLIVAASFLSRPVYGELLFPAVVLAIVIGVIVKRRWLVYIAQSAIVGLILLRVFEPGEDLDVSDVPLAALWIVVGLFLAWLIARAIPSPVSPR